MADAEDQTHSRKGFKRPAQKKVKPSTKLGKCKSFSQKSAYGPKERARVCIGLALERWRALKAAHGLRNDTEVALHLLDLPATSGASDEKIKFSQSEVQRQIKREVCSAIKMNKTKLQGLIEAIQELDRGVNFESSIQKLEARTNTASQRAEAALAYMAKKKKKSPLPSLINVDIIRSDSEEETVEKGSQTQKSMEKSEEIFEMMETTKQAIKEIQADNKALTAALANLREELPSPALTPHDSPDCKVIKKEPENWQTKENNFETSLQLKEPETENAKKECPSPGNSNSPMYTDSELDKPLYPPLPPTTSPSAPNMEATSYNIPQRPEVRLALIRKPARLSVLWNVKEKDPFGPPMDCYSVLMTTEKVKGSGIFSKWTTLDVVKAISLPICVMISKYKPGHRVCVAVVGKDVFGRYGPYSEVVTAAIPE